MRLTSEQAQFIRDNYLRMSYRDIGAVIGRSERAVCQWVADNNLPRKRPQNRPSGRRSDNQRVFAPPAVAFGRGPANLPGEPVITERTRIVRAAAPVDARYAPSGSVRVVDARHCRRWALEVCK